MSLVSRGPTSGCGKYFNSRRIQYASNTHGSEGSRSVVLLILGFMSSRFSAMALLDRGEPDIMFSGERAPHERSSSGRYWEMNDRDGKAYATANGLSHDWHSGRDRSEFLAEYRILDK